MAEVKICGVTNIEEALAAHSFGADYVGLLIDIPKTNLSLTADDARKIVNSCPDIRFIVLTIEQDPDKLLQILNTILPWGVQLLRPAKHLVKFLKSHAKVKVIPVIHVVDENSVGRVEDFVDADYILLDSKVGDHLGGTGRVHDWNISKRIIENSQIPIFLAGGLSVLNVEKAVSELKPFAVDVESSLRNNKGFRDLEKVREFISVCKNIN